MRVSQSKGDGDGKQWSSFADFQDITSKIHEDVNTAVDAYAYIDSKKKQNMGVTPQTAVRARRAIMRIAKRLFFEVKVNKNVDEFEEIYERWSGDDGYLARLDDVNLRTGVPVWLGDLVDDIIEASWRLGYLKAGVEKPSDPTDPDQQAKEMFEK